LEIVANFASAGKAAKLANRDFIRANRRASLILLLFSLPPALRVHLQRPSTAWKDGPIASTGEVDSLHRATAEQSEFTIVQADEGR
jgi:hypothetical protein